MAMAAPLEFAQLTRQNALDSQTNSSPTQITLPQRFAALLILGCGFMVSVYVDGCESEAGTAPHSGHGLVGGRPRRS
jgi:hypothetical protein